MVGANAALGHRCGGNEEQTQDFCFALGQPALNPIRLERRQKTFIKGYAVNA
jgi:hypothetical protein